MLMGLIVISLLLLSGCTGKPNILLISIDSLRADHLGAYGYSRQTSPAIDRLAAQGALFTNAVSSTSWTLPAHIALLTGLPDTTHGVTGARKSLNPGVTTLAQALKGAGYYTVGFYSGPFLHPAFGFARGFDEYVDCTSYRMGEGGLALKLLHRASHSDVTNPNVLWQLLSRLDQARGRRFFFFLHLWDVHYDYMPPPPFDSMFDPDYRGSFSGRDFGRNSRFKVGMDRADFEHVVALYDGEIRFTDETIALILQAMEERGLLDNTLVVITGDHGDEFLDHGNKGHRHTLYQELIHVPLIFWYPSRIAPRKVKAVVRLIDVAPTILEVAGLPGLGAGHGRSLRPLLHGGEEASPRAALAELSSAPRSPDLTALRLGDEKVIINDGDGSGEYYDLAQDPEEKMPRQLSEVDSALRLVEMARALKQSYRVDAMPAVEMKPGALGQGTIERLRALGYIR